MATMFLIDCIYAITTLAHNISGAHDFFIDHFFMNEAFSDMVQSSEVFDSGISRLPLVLHISDCVPVKNSNGNRQSFCNNKKKRLRWDRADLNPYYHSTNDIYLSAVLRHG
jgi:hypothetical protein